MAERFGTLLCSKGLYSDFDLRSDEPGFDPRDEFNEALDHRIRRIVVQTGQQQVITEWQQDVTRIGLSAKGAFPDQEVWAVAIKGTIALDRAMVVLIGYEMDFSVDRMEELLSGRIGMDLSDQGPMSIVHRSQGGDVRAFDHLSGGTAYHEEEQYILAMKDRIIAWIPQASPG
jgi:hypothetical protein